MNFEVSKFLKHLFPRPPFKSQQESLSIARAPASWPSVIFRFKMHGFANFSNKGHTNPELMYGTGGMSEASPTIS